MKTKLPPVAVAKVGDVKIPCAEEDLEEEPCPAEEPSGDVEVVI